MGTEIGSDTAELHRGWVTMTPLTLDSTAYLALPGLPELVELQAPQKYEVESGDLADSEYSGVVE